MKVKVVKSKCEFWWYADKIGQVLEVEDHDKIYFKVIYNGYFIEKDDVEVVEDSPKVPTRKNLKLELRVKGLELTVKVLEQDDVDTNLNEGLSLSWQSSDGFYVISENSVELFSGAICVKGSKNSNQSSRSFSSETELKDYITRLKQAVKEFNAAGGFAKKVEETVEIIE